MSQTLTAHRVDLKGKRLEELEQLLLGWGEPAYRARQIMRWLYSRGVGDVNDMTDLPKALRERLAEEAMVTSIKTQVSQESIDGTRKFLFELHDKVTIESVIIPDGDRLTACISSQAGCGIGCSFCATALGGLLRNLTAAEIIDQLVVMQQAVGRRLNNVVMMGMGEPLANYKAVLDAVHLMVHPLGLGIGQRHITISTSGVVPGIRRLAQEGLQVVLALSLHAPVDPLRDELVPLNKKYPISEVLSACREYQEVTGRRVTIEYVLIHDVNDSPELADALGDRLQSLHCHVNLIPLNPVKETGFLRPPPERVRMFAQRVEACGIPVTVRKEMGTDIDAACGQLRRRRDLDRGLARNVASF